MQNVLEFENVALIESWCKVIFANFLKKSFSTATPDFTHHPVDQRYGLVTSLIAERVASGVLQTDASATPITCRSRDV
jgi:hypothetical protein